MSREVNELLRECPRRAGASPDAIRAVEARMGVELPRDYQQFLVESDGIEGPLGSAAYLVLWPVNELVTLNAGYSVSEFIPGITLIGGDGGGSGYGFRHVGDMVEFVAVPLVGMDLDEVTVLGASFAEMLQQLAASS